MGGLYTLHDILTAIAEGKMQSFVEGDTWAITKIAVFPRARLLEIMIVVGDLKTVRNSLIAFINSPTKMTSVWCRPMVAAAGLTIL